MSDVIEVTGKLIDTHDVIRVTITGDKISSITPVVDPGAPFIAPAFIDIQVNGYRGIDYSGPDLSEAGIESLVVSLGKGGTGRHLPTIITNSHERILANLRTIARAIEERPLVAAAVPGIHVEGPYISPEDGPRGAHDPRFIRNPSIREYHDWQAASGHRIRIITVAPELPGAIDYIRTVTGDGVVAAIGHSAATPEQISAAVDAGARFSTHLGNGSHSTLPRLKNYLWTQLASDDLIAGVISDGFHLPDDVVRVFYRAKSSERLVLTSDVAPLGGCAPGRYKWGNVEVEVHPDGHVGLAGTEFLAGAGHLLDRCLVRFMRATGVSLDEAISLCTTLPCQLVGIPRPEIAVGAKANLVVFRLPEIGDSLEICQTVLAGQVVHLQRGANTWS